MAIVYLSNGKNFLCASGQTILDAANSNGLSLEHSCRSGRCGVCKTQVIWGVTRPLQGELSLSVPEQSAGYILTCARTPVTDVSIGISDIENFVSLESKVYACRINKIIPLSSDVIQIDLRTPSNSGFYFLPGQHIRVIAAGGVRRSYSMANAPRKDGSLALLIKRVRDGQLSRYWFDTAKPNDLLRFEGPIGSFCLRKSEKSHLVLLATGTGIAPIRSILEQLAQDPSANTFRYIHLYWGGRTAKDIFWVPEFPSLQLRFTPVLSQSHAGSAVAGYVQNMVIEDRVPLHDSVVYACGSVSMVSCARRLLSANGLHSGSFFSDVFVSS